MDESGSILRTSAAGLGVDLCERESDLLLKHLDAVLLENRRVNLTAPISREKAIMRHTVDSLAPLPLLADDVRRLLDLGTGAGFPGIPLGIVGTYEVHLLESSLKKTTFLRAVLGELGSAISAEVHRLRAEEMALAEPCSFDAVTVRAVASLPALLELAAPLLRRGGVLVAMKGLPSVEELERGERAAEAVGMRERRRHAYELPVSGDSRLIVTYEKTCDSRIRLPRRVGMAQKRPLA